MRPGQVLDLAEEEYQYGRGRLRLRVLEVRAVRQLGGATWAEVRGHVLGWQDRVAGERFALVKVPARPPAGSPGPVG